MSGSASDNEMSRELLIDTAKSNADSRTYKSDFVQRYRRARSSSSSKSQRRYFVVETTDDDDFRTYRKFSADAGCHSSGQREDGIVMSLLRRCRSQSNSRCNSRRPQSDDEDDDVTEHIELCQLSGFSRLADVTDAGHKFITVYVDVPVWCDKCGQLIIGVYGYYVLCQCEYFIKRAQEKRYNVFILRL